MSKKAFDIDRALDAIEQAVKPWPKAAMFELAESGFDSPFEQLAACMISIRTYDEVTVPTAQKLFERARTPAQMSKLSVGEIDALIHSCTFHDRKAEQILTIAKRLLKDYNGRLPCDAELMQSFAGVGPKCAHLVLGVACHEPFISVDVHVHRATNRWGYVQAASPERTMLALEAVLPKKHWIDINRLLVPFGKHICTGKLPKCSTCPVLDMCRQVGVTEHR
ncbi:MAG TPA: endonuclease III [Anaerolineales bacterium]|nr:endonuclease III [Anaerolineales bacterium]